MSIDLSKLSPRELGKLITTAKKQKAALAKRKPITLVRARLVKLAKSEGYSIQDLFGGGGSGGGTRKVGGGSKLKGRKLGKVEPKYRNPANPKETWSGRGKQPRWLAAYTSKGRSLGDFVIPGAAKPTPKTGPVATKKTVVKKAKK
jgi:DNA-binding protein H-NS